MNNHIKESVSLSLKENARAEYVITENASEKIVILWDGERFGICHRVRTADGMVEPSARVYNPREALDVATFIMTVKSLVKEIV